MPYYNQLSGEFGITFATLKRRYKHVSLPKNVAEFEGYYLYSETQKPEYDTAQQSLLEGLPVLTEQGWKQTWRVEPLSAEKALHSLNLEKERVLSQVSQVRFASEAQGVTFAFSDGQGTVQTRNDTDIRNINGLVSAALVLKAQGVTDPVLSFRDEQNVTHNLTPDEALAMGMAVQAHISQTYHWAWEKKQQIQAVTTAQELRAIEI